MKSIHNLEVGYEIKAVKYGKSVAGEIVKKLPGAVVIINKVTEEKEVVDVDRITEIVNKNEK